MPRLTTTCCDTVDLLYGIKETASALLLVGFAPESVPVSKVISNPFLPKLMVLDQVVIENKSKNTFWNFDPWRHHIECPLILNINSPYEYGLPYKISSSCHAWFLRYELLRMFLKSLITKCKTRNTKLTKPQKINHTEPL